MFILKYICKKQFGIRVFHHTYKLYSYSKIQQEYNINHPMMAIVIMSQLYPRDFIGIYYDEDDDVIQRIREEIVQKKLRNYPFDMAICTDDMGELDISRTWAYGPVFYIFNKQFPFINNEKMKCVLFGDNFRRILLTNQLISHKITPDPVGTNNMYITLRATFAYE